MSFTQHLPIFWYFLQSSMSPGRMPLASVGQGLQTGKIRSQPQANVWRRRPWRKTLLDYVSWRITKPRRKQWSIFVSSCRYTLYKYIYISHVYVPLNLWFLVGECPVCPSKYRHFAKAGWESSELRALWRTSTSEVTQEVTWQCQ